MTDILLNGNPVKRGDLKRPYQGAWTAELDLDADEVPTGEASLVCLGRTFSGTVVAEPTNPAVALSGLSGGWYRCRIVGGAGGLQVGALATPIEPQSFDQGATVQQVLGYILGQAGEVMATDVDADLLARFLMQWSCTSGSCSGALAALVDYLGGGIVWRIRADGRVWLGVPAPAAVDAPDYIVTDIAPETGQAAWDLTTFDLEPDQIIDGLTLRQVVYTWQTDQLRALVTFAPGPVNSLYALFGGWLRRAGLDYLRAIPGRINSQSGSTVEFQPDSSAFPPFRRTAIRLGLPDTEVSILPSGRAVACWEGGTPAAPVLQSFGSSQASKIKIGTSAVAGTLPLVNKAQRDAEQTLDQAIEAAIDAIPTAAAPTEPLAVAIRAALVAIRGAIATYEGTAGQYLTTILEGG